MFGGKKAIGGEAFVLNSATFLAGDDTSRQQTHAHTTSISPIATTATATKTTTTLRAAFDDSISPSNIPEKSVTGISKTLKKARSSLMAPPDIRVLSPDIEKESQKVRSLYESGDSTSWGDVGRLSTFSGERLETTPEDPSEENENDPYGFLVNPVIALEK
jgi:hypothetical protein